MCGRYVHPDQAAIERAWHIGREDGNPFGARFNVAPTTRVPVLRLQDSTLELTGARWGFVRTGGRTRSHPSSPSTPAPRRRPPSPCGATRSRGIDAWFRHSAGTSGGKSKRWTRRPARSERASNRSHPSRGLQSVRLRRSAVDTQRILRCAAGAELRDPHPGASPASPRCMTACPWCCPLRCTRHG